MTERFEYDCVECGRHFSAESQGWTLCPKCRAKLPHCDCCGGIMGMHLGYMEDRARAIEGFGDICTACDSEIRHKGFLHLEERGYEVRGRKPQRFLLPDGTIDDKMPERSATII